MKLKLIVLAVAAAFSASAFAAEQQQSTKDKASTSQSPSAQGSSAQGSSAQSPSAQGSSAQGASKAQGSSAPGAAGSKAQGSSAQGSSAQGSSAQRSSAQGASKQSGAAAGAQAPGGKQQAQGMSSDTVKKAQQALKDKGHDPGPIDGQYGPLTQKGVKDFQEKQNMKATGRLDQQTLSALGVQEGSSAVGAGSGRKDDKTTGKKDTKK